MDVGGRSNAPSPPQYFPSWSVDISSKDDITVILLFGVSFNGANVTACCEYSLYMECTITIFFSGFCNIHLQGKDKLSVLYTDEKKMEEISFTYEEILKFCRRKSPPKMWHYILPWNGYRTRGTPAIVKDENIMQLLNLPGPLRNCVTGTVLLNTEKQGVGSPLQIIGGYMKDKEVDEHSA